MKLDFIGFLALVAISVVVGFGLNLLRAKPLPLVYQPPTERLASAIETRDARRESQEATVEAIELEDLKNLVGKPGALILDARPDLFYEAGHIPSALNLSKEDFEKDFNRLLPKLREFSRDTRHSTHNPIVVYCADSSCDDSQIVAEALARLGFGPIHTSRTVGKPGKRPD